MGPDAVTSPTVRRPRRYRRGLALAFVLAGAFLVFPATAVSAGQDAPQVVRVGVYFENLSNVDLKEGSFQADFYLWFRWTGDIDPTATYEFTNTLPLELSAVPGSAAPDGSPVAEDLEDGSKYQLFHVHGRFLGEFDVDDYPFDDARLLIRIEDVKHDSSELVFELDDAMGMSPTLQVGGWNVRKPVGTVADHRYATSFGYPGATEGDVPFSRVEIAMEVSRPGMTLAIQSIFPLVVIIFAALASLLIDSPVDEGHDAHWWFLATRLSLAVPAVIAAVALQFTASPGVPREGQVLLVDRIYLLSYAVILVVIGVTVIAHRFLRRGDAARAERLDRRVLLFVTPGYLGAILLILLVR